MSFKSLNIRREKVEDNVRSFDPSFEIIGPTEKPGNLFIYKIVSSGEPEALINVYHNKDGSTTLFASGGKNPTLSQRIAEHVVNTCEIKDTVARHLSIGRLTQHHYEDLIAFMELNDCTITDGSNLQHGIQKKVIGPYGDHVFLNYFNTQKFNVQGGSNVVKSIVIEALTQHLPYKNVIQSQLVVIDVDVTVDQIINEFEQIIPTAYPYLGEKLVAIMSPAIALQHINIELSDYSVFAYPALRGLEGYMKKLLLDKGYETGRDGFGSILAPDGYKHKITEAAAAQIKCVKTVKAIEDSYNYYNRHRNSLFHVDQEIETTRTIEERRVAEEIVRDVLSIIETSYVELNSKT